MPYNVAPTIDQEQKKNLELEIEELMQLEDMFKQIQGAITQENTDQKAHDTSAIEEV